MVRLSRLLSKKTGRSIRNNWGQFLAIVGIATLALTLFLGLTSSAMSFEDRVNRFYEQGNIADIWVTVNEGKQTEYDALDEYIGSPEDGAEKNKRTIVPLTYVNSINANALIYQEYPTISKPVIVSGEDPSKTNSTNYFIMDYKFVSSLTNGQKVKVGDAMSVVIPQTLLSTYVSKITESFDQFPSMIAKQAYLVVEALLQEPAKLNFEVTATMEFDENIQTGSYCTSNYLVSYENFQDKAAAYLGQRLYDILYETDDSGRFIYNSILIPLEVAFNNGKKFNARQIKTLILEASSGIEGMANQYLCKLANGKEPSLVKQQIQEAFGNNISYIYDIDGSPFNMVVQADIDQAYKLTYVFPVVFFLVAVLVICTTISQLIVKERIQIGTMKAIGISKIRIIWHYLSIMFVLVLMGVILGAIIGPLLIPKVMSIKYEILYTLPPAKIIFPWQVFIVCVLALFLITAAVVILSCYKEIRKNPAESMRPPVAKSIKTKKVESTKTHSSKSFAWKMAIRNIRLNIIKSAMVVLGVAGCTMLLVGGFGVDDTLNYSVNHDLTMLDSSDAVFSYETISQISKYEAFMNMEYVKSVEEYSALNTTIFTSEATIDSTCYAVKGEHQYFKVEFDPTKVAISQKVAQDLNLSIGDTVEWRVSQNLYSGVVGTIYDAFIYHGIVVNADYQEYYQLGRRVTNAWVDFKDGTNIDAYSNYLVENIAGIKSFTTRQETAKTVKRTIDSISLMTLTVKVFAVLLAVVVLYNLIYLNYKERYREMATLKVLGFSRAEIAKSFILEGMILVLVGSIIGMTLGFPFEYLVLFLNRNAIVEFLYTVTVFTYIISFLISFVTAFVLNMILSVFIKKIEMVESLKSIE